jgi:hypothetical protein
MLHGAFRARADRACRSVVSERHRDGAHVRKLSPQEEWIFTSVGCREDARATREAR